MLRKKNKKKLERVADYYLNVDHLPTVSYEAKKQIVLGIVTVSGAALFINPANRYVSQHYKDIAYYIHFGIGTATTGLAVMYNATEIFLTTRQAETIPEELADLLESPLTPAQKRIKDSSLLIGAAFSALPMAAVSHAYPFKSLPAWMNYVQTGLVEVDNTILHFLPIDLAFREPLYRFPILPFEYAYYFYKERSLTREEKMRAEEKQINEGVYHSLKQRLIDKLSHTQKTIVLKGLSFDSASLSYVPQLPPDLKQIPSEEKKPGFTKLSTIMEYGGLLKASSSYFSSFPRIKTTLGHVDFLLQNLAYTAGALWIMASCSGSLASTYGEANRLLESREQSALVASPAIYSLSVLLAFFGGNALRDTYHYFTSWGEDQVKIPLEFKLYPKASALLLLLATYLAYFSYGGNCQLEKKYFSDTKLDFLLPDLYQLTKYGMPFLSGISMIGFYRTVISKFALHFGNDEAKMVSQLNLMIERLKSGIQLMKGEDLIAALEELDNEQLNNFGVPPGDLMQLKTQLVKKKAEDNKYIDAKDGDNESLEVEKIPLLSKPYSKKQQSSWCPWLFKPQHPGSQQVDLRQTFPHQNQFKNRYSYLSTST